MELVLKEFQEKAVVDLFRYARQAREAALEGDHQALILAAPTGSGKTVMADALFERILDGDESNVGDPNATFLWLTDQPELNEQTRRKFATNSSAFSATQLVTIDAAKFNEPRFAPGHCYFLNTQKLGEGKQLTVHGDKRKFTIWDTITKTVEDSPGSFWLVIDEAHRGMQGGDPEFATTIVQKFVLGSNEIPAVPLILGISATPQRFQTLLAGTPRHQRPLEIKPDAVRDSGLIKDWITVYHPTEKQASDWTLLRAAADKLNDFAAGWKSYAEQEKEQMVEPLLVVQVEDAPSSGKEISATPIGEAIREIEDVLGPLQPEELAHSLQEGSQLSFGDRVVPYIAPPDIQDRTGLRVVFFKMALNTGWDCPRAEVMMSFRRAVDYTNIAQLVGRMVRTPFADRVSSDETLNTVALYLPHFDTESLEQVIGYLENPDTVVGLAVKARRGEFTVEISRDAKLGAIFDFAEALPTYIVERVAKMSDVRRLVRLSRYLAQDKLDEKAWDVQRSYVVSRLEKERNRLKNTKAFQTAVAEAGKLSVQVEKFALPGGANGDGERDDSTVEMTVAEQNVQDLYNAVGRQLGEGLNADFVKARVASDKSMTLTQAKVELYALLSDAETFPHVEEASATRFTTLYTKHQSAINGLPEVRRHAYRRLLKMASRPQATPLMLPQKLLADSRGTNRDKHLFVDAKGRFPVKLNGWETEVLTDAMNENDFVAWLRNEPRQEWSLCVPYKHHADDKPHYPDFLVFRKSGEGFIADILEPHSLSYDDGWAKARGLAEYAKQHGDLFGRIQLIGKVKRTMRRLDLKDASLREKVLVVNNNEQLVQLLAKGT